MKLRLQHR